MFQNTAFLNTSAWGSPCEIETRRRIRIAVAMYAYEIKSETIMSDHEYDAECFELQKNLHIDTDRPDLDAWFRKTMMLEEGGRNSTGSDIYNHPEFDKIERLYNDHFAP